MSQTKLIGIQFSAKSCIENYFKCYIIEEFNYFGSQKYSWKVQNMYIKNQEAN